MHKYFNMWEIAEKYEKYRILLINGPIKIDQLIDSMNEKIVKQHVIIVTILFKHYLRPSFLL